MDQGVLLWRDIGSRVLQEGVRDPHGHGGPVSRRARDDAIEVLGEHLRFLESLPSSRRTTVPIRSPGRLSIEGPDDGFGFDRHLVFGAPGEIDQLFGMPERKAAAGRGMAGVGRGRGVSGLEGSRHQGIVERPGPAAVADDLQLPVPARHGKPDLDPDIRIVRRA